MAQVEPVLDAQGAAYQVEDVDQTPVPLNVLNIGPIGWIRIRIFRLIGSAVVQLVGFGSAYFN